MIDHIQLSHKLLVSLFISFLFILYQLDLHFSLIAKITRIAKQLSSSKKFLIILFLSSFLILSFWANSVMQRYPIAGSEYTYIYQAQTFLKGRIWNNIPPPEFFANSRIITKDGKYFPKTFPGWSFLLSIAIFFHLPTWLLNPLIGTMSLIIIFLIAKLLYNNTVGLLTVIGALCSPYFLFNAASYVPNVPSGCLTLLAVYFYYSFSFRKQNPINLLWIGICLGGAYLIRPFSTLSCLAPVLIALIAHRKMDFFKKDIWYFMLGFIPFLLIHFSYNYLTTGNLLLSPFNYADAHDTVQFKIPVMLNNLNSVDNQFYWMNPVILILYFFIIGYLIFKQKIQAPELIFFILIGSCFFYLVPGGFGNRYYFEGYLLCILTVLGRLSQIKNENYKHLLSLCLTAGFLTNIMLIPIHALINGSIIHSQSELYRLVENKHLSNAIVFVPPEGSSKFGKDIRNDPDLQNDVLFANDLKEKNVQILKYFPSRDYYLYVPEEKDENQRIQILPLT